MSEKAKSHVSYPKDLRSAAKDAGRGLVTVHIETPDGERTEYQMVADLDECAFAKWAGVLIGRPDVRPLPKLEEVVRAVCEERGITS